MRVTHQMIANQVVFNLAGNIERFMRLQNQMSTNRRINTPSDDPIGTIKDLAYRERLSEITQFKSNISVGRTWLAFSDVALDDVNTAIRNAYAVGVEMSNDTYDASARAAAANEVQSLLDQILAAGNSQLQNDYIFGGYRTKTRPFDASSNGVVYRGDFGIISHSIDARAKVQVNSIGATLFTTQFRTIGADSDVKLGIIGTTPLSSLNSGNGVDLTPGTFTIKDVNLNLTVAVDLSGATTVDDAISAINSQLAAGGITNLQASLGLEGNNLRLVAIANSQVSLDTPLGNLNQGRGIDLQTGTFVIRDATATINATIDLAGSATLGDAITAINTQLVAAGVTNVNATLNAGGTGIDIVDSNGTPLGLLVEESNAQGRTAADLGILGFVDPVLNGADLDPRPEFVVGESAAGETTAADLGLLGQFYWNQIGTDLRPQLLPTTLLSQFNNNLGTSTGQIKIAQGDSTFILDTGASGLTTVQDLLDAMNSSGLTITAAINGSGTGIQITNNDPTKTLVVTDNDDRRTASLLGIAGSGDVLGSMMFLVHALRENDRESVSRIIGTLNEALNKVLDERATVGAKVVRMDTTQARLEQYELSYTRLLSEVEDADLTQLITQLAMQENAYTAALNAAARIIQPSLLNFIR